MRFTLHSFIRMSPLMLASAVLGGCADGVTTPAPPSPTLPGQVAGHSAPVPDLQGLWVFEERIWVLQPSALNPIIGAPAVATPMTQVVCDAEGTLDLEQLGATFWGTATQSVVCHVDGVQFVPPPFAFNPVFAVRNGRIHGHSLYFETGHVIGDGDEVPTQESDCANRGSIRVVGGVVDALEAVGNCPVPFHPGEQHSSWSIRRP